MQVIEKIHCRENARSDNNQNEYPWWNVDPAYSSASRMHVTNHNWSATKQRLHSSFVECSQDKPPFSFVNVGHRLGLITRTQISVCKSPFSSAGNAVSVFCAKTV